MLHPGEMREPRPNLNLLPGPPAPSADKGAGASAAPSSRRRESGARLFDRLATLCPQRFVGTLRRSWRPLCLGPGLLGLASAVVGFWQAAGTAESRLQPNPAARAIVQSLDRHAADLELRPDAAARWLTANPTLLSLSATRLGPASSPAKLRTAVSIDGTSGLGDLRVLAAHRSAEQGVAIANTVATTVIELLFERDLARRRAAQQALDGKIASVDDELTGANQALIQFQRGAGAVDFEKETPAHLQEWVELENRRTEVEGRQRTLDLQIENLLGEVARHSPELQAAREALQQARLTMTEEHPRVQQLRAAVTGLEERLAGVIQGKPDLGARADTLAASILLQTLDLRKQRIGATRELEVIDASRARLVERLGSLPQAQVEYARLKSRYTALRRSREALDTERQTAVLLLQSPAPSFVAQMPATPATFDRTPKYSAALRWGLAGSSLAALAGLAGLWLVDRLDRRIRTPQDLATATGLPVLAVLEEFKSLRRAARENWAFHTFTALRTQLVASPANSLVCGFTSSRPGEGRSTWIKLLGDAAAKQGYHVLAISTTKSRRRSALQSRPQAPSAAATPPHSGPDPVPAAQDAGLVGAIEAATTLVASGDRPLVELPLADWVWNLEQRQHWQQAFARWQAMPNLVVLVELPPAALRETFLLAESLPQILWLCAQDMAIIEETRAQMLTLQLSSARIAGAVFNRAGRAAKAARAAAAAALLTLATAWPTAAQETDSTTPPPNVPQSRPGNLTLTSTNHLADWQKRLTLGPGDQLEVSLYGQTDSSRQVLIGPDGRFNYLQAEEIQAAGLTVDELRAKLEEILGKFYLSPRAVVIPAGYSSKKYLMMGSVVQKGAFQLSRPVTIVEAVAGARGFVSVTQPRGVQLQADLSRSFLIRKFPDGTSRRLDIDFEALFLRGDLNQNIGVAPDDYLYFPPIELQQIFVLGEVTRPGAQTHAEKLGVLQAVAAAGGFTDRAYRTHVLVVRGSLKTPQTFVINAKDTLRAKRVDFELKSRDIVYVARRPWSKAEELLESAVTDFFRAAVITWTGQNVGPFIKEPIIE